MLCRGDCVRESRPVAAGLTAQLVAGPAVGLFLSPVLLAHTGDTCVRPARKTPCGGHGRPLFARLLPRATGRRARHRRDYRPGAVAGLSEPSADPEPRAADKRKAPTRDDLFDTRIAPAD